ncbi:vicilin-like seed storage protein At2g28490 isoform X1 [Spinacia oleracea]|uniref:Vicilin-like seed storage protein At2g28490 isoform X1 n=1 Tax=Spinacia oleracea TaxID=3562 RepID=A0ABM3RCC4_SPIOL|nr:vicilin-like seed storage protein At2g28490 isoform X1 [Spinacia oleracea]
MGRLKGVLLVALVVCYAMQVVVSQSYEERRRERELMSPEEEERRAKEEDWRRREKTAEEERRHRRSWEEEEEEEEERGRRKWDEDEEEQEEEERGRQPRPKPRPEPYRPGGRGGEGMFVLRDSKKVISTQAGEMRVVRGYGGKIVENPLDIGFITMEPRSLFVPQYLDSSLIIFLRRGEAKLGFIYDDELSERQLKMGDVYRIPAGSTFYIVNTGETQRLHIICSIDPSEGLGFSTFQSFFIGGGTNPVSVLAGFDPETLSTAFNVSIGELRGFMTGQDAGPIIFADTTHSPSLWANFLKVKGEERLERLKTVAESGEQKEEEEEPRKSWWNIFDSLIGSENKKGEKKGDTRTGSSPDSYNLLDREPSYRNNYGWSIAVDKHEYKPLKKSGIGVYLVNLTAGSMMAPHVNPMATEYGVVLSGVGTIQVVYPNGTSAMNTNVKEGDVFWIPRYFPFCQIASRSGSFEFFGFTTSAHRNRPQFLVGASSILRSMRGPEFATAFGLTEDRYNEIVDAQREALILPSPSAASGDTREFEEKEQSSQEKKPESKEQEKEKPGIEKVPKFMRTLGPEMIMGFE